MHFTHPKEIEQYGLIIEQFNQAGKALAGNNRSQAISDDQKMLSDSFAGHGAYNSVDITDFVRYGEEQFQAFKAMDKSGLFGIFPLIHRPELKLCQSLPKLLSEQGYGLLLPSGEKIPLSAITFDFIPRDKDNKGIIIVEKLAEPSQTTLPQNTQLIKGDRWIAGKNFNIVDGQGNPITDEMAAKLLWLTIGATKGLKRQGRNTPEFSTIANDGPDDDFNAERQLIEVLTYLENSHSTDLMPVFNKYVQETKAGLAQDKKGIDTIATIIELGKALKEVQASWTVPMYLDSYSKAIITASDHLTEVMEYFDIDVNKQRIDPAELEPTLWGLGKETIEYNSSRKLQTIVNGLTEIAGHARKCPSAIEQRHDMKEMAEILESAIKKLTRLSEQVTDAYLPSMLEVVNNTYQKLKTYSDPNHRLSFERKRNVSLDKLREYRAQDKLQVKLVRQELLPKLV